VVAESSQLRIKFIAEKPAHRQSAKRCTQPMTHSQRHPKSKKDQ
jgi:hypothetical protein